MDWQLWRQDDNGNRFLVDSFSDRAAAQSRLEVLQAVPHKQFYWITAASSVGGADRDSGSNGGNEGGPPPGRDRWGSKC